MTDASGSGSRDDPRSEDSNRHDVEEAERQVGDDHDTHNVGDSQSVVAYSGEAAEIARELVIDLRAELPRIDARAAAGVALTAAVLVGLVSQAPAGMPIYAVAVAAAVLLTISLLLFLMVLLPTPTLPAHRSLARVQASAAGRPSADPAEDSGTDQDLSSPATSRRHKKRDARIGKLEEMGRQLATELSGANATEYHATVAIQISSQVRAKQRLLILAFMTGAFGVGALAVGAAWALLLGWR